MTDENIKEEPLIEKDGNVKSSKQLKGTKEIGLIRIVKAVLFFVCALTLEIIILEVTFGRFLPNFFLFDLTVFFLFSCIILLIPKNWVANLVFVLLLMPQVILSILNLTLKNSIEDYFIFNMFSIMVDGIKAFNFSFFPFGMIGFYLIFFLVLVFALINLDKYVKKQIKLITIKKFSLDLMIFTASMVFLFVTYITQIIVIQNSDKKTILSSNKALWNGELVSTAKGIKKFGLYGFYLSNFYTTYLKSESFDKQFLLSYVKDGEVESNSNAKLYGDNLIMINVESLDSFAIDPINTPNLWNLINGNSVYFSEFHGKNQTNISEIISILGYMPNYSIYRADKDSLSSKYSLANLFNEQGYQTTYFHPLLNTFYQRESTMKNLGFKDSYYLKDMENWDGIYDFDSLNPETQFFESLKDKIIPTDGSKFFTYYMTAGTHGDYKYNQKFDKYYEMFQNNLEEFKKWFENETNFEYPEYSDVLQRFYNFKSVFIETDEMIGNLFKYLEETEVNGTKLIDNTTVVIFGDHDCFYYDISNSLKRNLTGDDLYNIPMLIYSKKLENQKNDKFCSTYDIYPTICNLFGLKYNENMCMGDNIFSEDFDTIFYSVKDSVGFMDSTYKLLQLDNLHIRYDGAPSESKEAFMQKVNVFLEKLKNLNQIYDSRLKC